MNCLIDGRGGENSIFLIKFGGIETTALFPLNVSPFNVLTSTPSIDWAIFTTG